MVDYGDVERVTDLLVSKKVHVVISTIAVLTEATGKSEVDLVAAAAQSSVTKRFIASNWGGPIPEDEYVNIRAVVSQNMFAHRCTTELFGSHSNPFAWQQLKLSKRPIWNGLSSRTVTLWTTMACHMLSRISNR